MNTTIKRMSHRCLLLMVCARARSGGRVCCVLVWLLRNFSRVALSTESGGRRVDSWTRAAERCTGVTNAVVGAADGAPVRAERAPPLMGLWSGEVSGSG